MQMKKKTFSHDIWNDNSLKEKRKKTIGDGSWIINR